MRMRLLPVPLVCGQFRVVGCGVTELVVLTASKRSEHEPQESGRVPEG